MSALNPFKCKMFRIKSIRHALRLLKIGEYGLRIQDGLHYTVRDKDDLVWLVKDGMLVGSIFEGFIIRG